MNARTVRAFLATVCAVQLCGCSADPAVRKQQHFDSGARYFEQKKYREAAIEFRNAVQIDARYGAARKRLAQTHERLGDPAKALEEYVRAADLLPDDAVVQVRAGSYLLAVRRFDDAKVRAEAALALEPQNVEGQVLLGNALAGLRNIDQAIAEIEEAIRLDPTRGASYANLGVLEMGRGRAQQAEAAFKRATELAPKWVPGHLALANHYWGTGRSADAERALRIALEIDPENPIATRAIALFLISTNRTVDAEPYVKSLARSGSSPFALADFYLLQNRPVDAIPELQRLRTHEQTAIAATRRLAQAYAVRGDFADAQRVVDELLQNDPRDAESLLLKGQLLAQQGKRDEALAQLRAAAEVDPSSARLQFALGRTYAARGDLEPARHAYHEALRLNPRAAPAQVELSRLDLAAGRVTNSVQHARDAVRTEPTNIAARLALIRSLIAAGKVAEAEQQLAPLMEVNPNAARLLTLRAMAQLARKDYASAGRGFQQALRIDSGLTEAVGGLIAIEMASGNVASARTLVETALASHPDRADLLMLAARTASAAKDSAAAEQYLRRALQADPALLAGYSMLGRLYVSQGRLMEARKEYEIIAERQARPVAAVTMLGILAQAQGDTTQAQKHYEDVIAIDPGAPVAANNLAWLYAERGQNLETALQLAQKASAAMPTAPEVLDTLGWVYYKRQTSDRAVEALGNTVKLAPQNATYHYHLGLAYAQAGNTAAARESLERALTLDRSFADAGEARRLLENLRLR